ncbi:carboxylesterase/lipase family protein [Novosphingobium taihuense]|uniref:Carboxylic ester hydrolase n=1 Tax=Novosphingobium taihuense TaxID=260085 RepID=A0A7W7AC38_9SPHN|nr:carboxylesterase family protein [Novosphingobium taihuense]MBB4614182.1 para-nitrobenzyl esterase [Novosphingobium taihuense]TWH87031.1 para-nitrobenzyl esterase [Novosphingobium taihuense]
MPTIDRRHAMKALGTPLLLGAVTAGLPATLQAATRRCSDSIIARTRAGLVVGRKHGPAIAFKGIPYGGPTGGENRFMPPTPVAPWKEPLLAVQDGPASPQADPDHAKPARSGTTIESEDCLTLNVWTPALRDGRKRPVMVWLHGGGLWRLSAAGAYQDGSNLAGHGDVVMVSPNHRLGVLGFAWLQEWDAQFSGSASAGILDLVQALQWVRDHAEEFGGDPDNVTIFGQSGGGQKVSLLMAMPAAQGLFHKAIIQSGPAPLALEPAYAETLSRKLLDGVGVGPGRVADLQKVPLNAIMRAYHRIFEEIGGFGVMGVIQDFAPVVDGTTLPQHPFWNGASALSRDIPLMIGSTRTEMTEYYLNTHPSAPQRTVPEVVRDLTPIFGDDAQTILAHYRAAHPAASLWEVDALVRSDWPTRLFSRRIADAQASLRGAPVWSYRMDWATGARDGQLMSPHAIDIAFVLDTIGAEPVLPEELEGQRRMQRQMSNAWLAFARNGNPQHAGIPSWQPYDETRPTMLFNLESRLALAPDGADLDMLEAGISRYRVVAGGVGSG